MKTGLCGIGVLLLTSALSLAEAPAIPRDISAQLEPIIKQRQIPGMVAAIVQEGRCTVIGAAGVRRKGAPEKITVNDRFHIGSDTKAMTATLCALLVQDGKLSWSTTVGEAFPELRGRMNAQYASATLEQLLTNTAGVPHDVPPALWARLWQHKGTPTSARRLLAEEILAQAPEAAPGEKFIYSNAGFAIAGYMAEKKIGQSWEELMRQRLFKPLGMDSAGFGAPGTRGALTQPCGHTASGKPVEPGPGADNPVAIGPAGIVHCSIQDWAKFVSLHLGYDPQHLLQPDALKKLHTPPPGQTYAMGWDVTERAWAGGRTLTHAGSNTMWYAVAWLAPERKFAILVACNQGGESAETACDLAASLLVQMAGEKK